MALCNDNFWGYTTDIISRYHVRWIEAAIVSPCWTNFIVYYIEGDHGHLMTAKLGKQQFRTVARGSPVSYHMPWEDVLKDLKKNCLDTDLLEVPRPEECLKYMLRVHLRVNAVDLGKHLKQVHVRPFVLLLLLYFLIDRNHEVFRGKGSAVALKQKMQQAVEREYPETESHKPETERNGHVPPSILTLMQEADAEKREASAGAGCKTRRVLP